MGLTIRIISRALYRAGGLGLLTLGIFDSSPLVLPFGNDLLILALSARHHDRMIYYAMMATLGSVIGCLITDWLSRKGGERLKKSSSGKNLWRVQNLVQKNAAWTLLSASVLPPPFPFTAVVAAAAAFKYPRNKLLSFVGVGRLIRFLIEGALAIHYGRWIIRQAKSPILEDTMIALIVIAIAASIFSLYQWSEKSKRPASQHA
ncbi:MAG TPA: VTT domain-containing protein [Candidatus Saccharimonadales bacterium]|jgi:membrane protein YqaA with SNARE-associated domain|nr:VTT domain-containing protein [Candidatus Saccharimonadales bacterium]